MKGRLSKSKAVDFKMRTFEINRKTNETDIELSINLDGSGRSEINTGCGFLDHMLTLFAKHGRFDLTVKRFILRKLVVFVINYLCFGNCGSYLFTCLAVLC